MRKGYYLASQIALNRISFNLENSTERYFIKKKTKQIINFYQHSKNIMRNKDYTVKKVIHDKKKNQNKTGFDFKA